MEINRIPLYRILRELMFELLENLRPFHRALWQGGDQEAFEDVRLHVKNRIDAIQMLNHANRRWSFTLAAVTGLQREINELQERVDELEEQEQD